LCAYSHDDAEHLNEAWISVNTAAGLHHTWHELCSSNQNSAV